MKLLQPTTIIGILTDGHIVYSHFSCRYKEDRKTAAIAYDYAPLQKAYF
ncbi:MAG: hypothetical protein OIF50_09355 [Flavobacteriaceae bacterium]|nr:hypothetical protein [Flavobacteriaceae bacterium]